MSNLGSAAIVAVIFISGCLTPEAGSDFHYTRFSMGTVVEYTLVADDEAFARDAVRRAHEEMERVAGLLWEKDSLSTVYALNHSPDSLNLTPEAARFVTRSLQLAALSGGSFDPTIEPASELYHFDAEDPTPPSEDDLDAALRNVGFGRLRVRGDGTVSKDRPGVRLAVGGIAKGYAVDRAVGALRASGIKSAIVNAGGDMYCLGLHDGGDWNVGVRDPDTAGEVVAVLHVRNAAVATSGDYQQYFEYDGLRYHHILDPSTGRPARGVRSATVVAETAERADALATALFVSGPDRGLRMLDRVPDAEGMTIDADGVVRTTAGMAAYLNDALQGSKPADL